jgi:hypothetical protein
MDFLNTIERPWRHPMDYLALVFWLVLFAIVAFAMMDTLRVVTTWITVEAAKAAKTVVE